MAERSTMEPDIERSLGTDFARDSPGYRQCDTERPSSPMTLISPAGGLESTVTLISYGLHAAIIHSSIRVHRIQL